MRMSRSSELAKVERLFGQAQVVLRRYPNVVSVGVGLRKRKGKSTGEPCFVAGVTRKTDRVKKLLPRELLGVLVDVQLVEKPRLLASIAPAAQCGVPGRQERGQIGVVAQSGGKRYALTALHVLVPERIGIDVEHSPHKGIVVEGRELGASNERIGKLVKGGFDRDEDIACIELASDVEVSGVVEGTSVRLKKPRPVSTSILAQGVRVEVPGDASVTGFLVEWPVAARFDIETGSAEFSQLAKFELRTRHVRPGWSGSVVFNDAHEPLALLSFGSDARGAVPAFGYGFPLAPHWDAWNLSPLGPET